MADCIPADDDVKIIWLTNLYDIVDAYADHTSLAAIGAPEVREYQDCGVFDDQQIVQPTDIGSVTFWG